MQTASVTKELKGVELVDMEALANAGAVGFTDDGIPIMNEHVLVEAMKSRQSWIYQSVFMKRIQSL